jgi:SET domain
MFALKMNHSCDPNVMVILTPSQGAGLLALKPIKAGDELTVSYRPYIQGSWHRHLNAYSLYDLFNGTLCRCGSSLCIHKNMTLGDIKIIANMDMPPPIDTQSIFDSLTSNDQKTSRFSVLEALVLLEISATIDPTIIQKAWLIQQTILSHLKTLTTTNAEFQLMIAKLAFRLGAPVSIPMTIIKSIL